MAKEEVKFCKNCGKKLVGEEVCECAASKTTTSEGFDFMKTLMAIKDDAIKAIKKPVDVIEENTKAEDMPKTYMLLAIIAISFSLFIAAMFKGIFALAFAEMGAVGAIASSKIKIPYVKVVLYFTVVFALALVIYGLAMLIVQAIFKNKKLSFKQALTLSCAAYIPAIFVNLICALLGAINVNLVIVFIIYLVANLVITYNFAYGYAKYTDLEANKFGYALAVLLVISAIGSGIVSYIVTNNFASNLTGSDFVDTDDIEDLDLDDWDF